MAYVLDYTVHTQTEVFLAKGTDHADALAGIVKDVLALTSRHGTYEAADGEIIKVIGPTQKEWSEYYWANNRIASLRADVASARNKKQREEYQTHLDNSVQYLKKLEVKQRLVHFKINRVVMSQIEYIDGLED